MYKYQYINYLVRVPPSTQNEQLSGCFFTSIPLYTHSKSKLLLQLFPLYLSDGLSFMLNPSQKLVELVRILEERAYIFPGDPVQATEALRHIDGSVWIALIFNFLPFHPCIWRKSRGQGLVCLSCSEISNKKV